MDEDVLNMEVRKFLKLLGVTSQRAIEGAVRDAIRDGRLRGDEKLVAKVTVTIERIGLRHEIEGEIALA